MASSAGAAPGRPLHSDAHGSAAFGDPQRAKAHLNGDGLIVGRAPSWVSRTLGPATEAYVTAGWSRSHAPNQIFATRGDSSTLNLVRRDLLTPDEVMRLPADRLLLLRPGERPLLARKVRYFADREFRGLVSPAAAAAPSQALPRLDPQAMHRP